MIIVTMKGKDKYAEAELEKNYEGKLKPELEIHGIDIIREQLEPGEIVFQINGSTPIGSFLKSVKILDHKFKFEIEVTG